MIELFCCLLLMNSLMEFIVITLDCHHHSFISNETQCCSENGTMPDLLHNIVCFMWIVCHSGLVCPQLDVQPGGHACSTSKHSHQPVVQHLASLFLFHNSKYMKFMVLNKLNFRWWQSIRKYWDVRIICWDDWAKTWSIKS